METTGTSYQAGMTCKGRIIEVSAMGIQVELAQGVMGIIREQDAQGIRAEVGSVITVQVKSVEGQGLAVLTPMNVFRHGADWSKASISHDLAVSALAGLKGIVENFKQDLVQAGVEKNGKAAFYQQEFDARVQRAVSLHEEKRLHCEKARDEAVRATRDRMATVDQIVSASAAFSKGVPSKPKKAAQKAAEYQKIIFSDGAAVRNALEAKCRAYEEVCANKISESKRASVEEVNAAGLVREKLNREASDQYEEKLRNICQRESGELARNFNEEAVQTYSRRVLQGLGFDALRYRHPEKVPESIVLGRIGLEIPNRDGEDLRIIHTLEQQVGKAGGRREGRYEVEMPYCQRYQDGVSLLVRYSDRDGDYARKLIHPLVFKLFMSFPPGKLEVTMIDPKKTGGSFPDFKKLVRQTKYERIVDTRVWFMEDDIEAAMNRQLKRNSELMQAYGENWESRVKHTACRALVIADFPRNFSNAALQALDTIISNSAVLGICILIWADEDEFEKLKERDEGLYKEILSKMVTADYAGGRLMLSGKECEGMYLRLDEMQEVLGDEKTKESIIREISEHVCDATETISFQDMFRGDIYDSNFWGQGAAGEVAIPLGIKGSNSVVEMVMGQGNGGVEHHALVAGLPGAGKSTFLHTMIMSTLVSYDPRDVQMYLIDFKGGMEFSVYTDYRLPSLRVVAVNSEREFGLNILEELCAEKREREGDSAYSNSQGIHAYNERQGTKKWPKLLLVFDEVQELFRERFDGAAQSRGGDSITAKCISCIHELVSTGRAVGIHVILACQDFRNCPGLESQFSNMAIRIVVKGTANAESIMASDNDAAELLNNEPVGTAIYNGSNGRKIGNNIFRIAYLSDDDREELLTRMDEYYTDPVVAKLYTDLQTRVLLTDAGRDSYNSFNEMIRRRGENPMTIAKSEARYGLLLGQGFSMRKSRFIIELSAQKRENLLVACRSEELALGIFELAVVSVLHEELCRCENNAVNTLVYILDLSDKELRERQCDFLYLKAKFSDKIQVVSMKDDEDDKDKRMEEAVRSFSDICQEVLDLEEGQKETDKRIFFLIFGLNRAGFLRNAHLYDVVSDGRQDPMTQLKTILQYGPQHGVHSIIWSENISGIEEMLGAGYGSLFNRRIAYDLDKDSIKMFVNENDPESLSGKTAVYRDSRDSNNTHFRPYDILTKSWVNNYAQAYNRMMEERSRR